GFPALAANQLTGVYHVHLFFGETTPFVDELTLTDAGEGKIAGTMHVPDDFDAAVELAEFDLKSATLTFHLSLPVKYHEAYPLGLDYEIHFRQPYRGFMQVTDFSNFVGFVSAPIPKAAHVLEAKYVGNVVGFHAP
ncbi:MAG: hypothetical protein HYZ71_11720, partial [Deltaproteobacteria bacterium]|nr:hypothetical protein [Deltaproteobacteria bacterium]